MRMSPAILCNPTHLAAVCGVDTLAVSAHTSHTYHQARVALVAMVARITTQFHSMRVRSRAVHARLTTMQVSAAVVTIGRAIEQRYSVVVLAMAAVVLLGFWMRMSHFRENRVFRLWRLHQERLLRVCDRLQRIQADR